VSCSIITIALTLTLTLALRQVGSDEAAALQRMDAATPALLRWLGTYLNPAPGPAAMLDMGYGGGGPPQQPMCIQVLRMIP